MTVCAELQQVYVTTIHCSSRLASNVVVSLCLLLSKQVDSLYRSQLRTIGQRLQTNHLKKPHTFNPRLYPVDKRSTQYRYVVDYSLQT